MIPCIYHIFMRVKFGGTPGHFIWYACKTKIYSSRSLQCKRCKRTIALLIIYCISLHNPILLLAILILVILCTEGDQHKQALHDKIAGIEYKPSWCFLYSSNQHIYGCLITYFYTSYDVTKHEKCMETRISYAETLRQVSARAIDGVLWLFKTSHDLDLTGKLLQKYQSLYWNFGRNSWYRSFLGNYVD